MILILDDLDLDILKMYLYAVNEACRSRHSKVRALTVQIHARTDRYERTYYHAAFAADNNKSESNPSKYGLKSDFNPFKPSGAKWLHYKVFKAILV